MPKATTKKARARHKARHVPTAAQRRKTAYHEAGHAVIGRVLTVPRGSATIKPNYKEMSAGNAICHDPYACDAEWEKRGRYRGLNAAWHAKTICLMAGAEAERDSRHRSHR
jgi:hypothetical protein